MKRDNLAEREYARKTRKSQSEKEDPLPCFNDKKEIVVTIESVIIGITALQILQKRSMSHVEGLSFNPLTKEDSIHQYKRKR